MAGERTVADVARRLNIGEQALVDANPQLRGSRSVSPGQQLALPNTSAPAASATPANAVLPELAKGVGVTLERAFDTALSMARIFAGAAAPANAAPASAPFDAGTAKKVSEKYASDDIKPLHGGNARGGCMNAVYEGLGELFSPAEAQDLRKRVYRDSKKLEDAVNKRREAAGKDPVSEGAFNSIDRVWETLQREGKAAPPMEFTHKGGQWSPGVESTILDSLKGKPEGFYFFGVSVSDGYHSVMLAADTTQQPPKVYWLDQFSEGFDKRSSSYATDSTDVTGKLDQSLANVGTAKTRIWPLIPGSK